MVRMTNAECVSRADQILSVLARADSHEYIGEPISQLQHALQAGYWAQQSAQKDIVVLAALLHDLGHLVDTQAPTMADLGTVNHEGVGAAFLEERGCSKELTHLVRSHVQAKRYLCYRKGTYFKNLSPASRGTLEWQGGPMTQAEANEFENDPWFEVILRLRVFDEKAKDPNLAVPGLEQYRSRLIEHLSQTSMQEGSAC